MGSNDYASQGFVYSTIQRKAYELNINHQSLYPAAINALGQIVGAIQGPGGDGAYIYKYGSFTSLNPPGSIATHAVSINDFGEVVGNYQTKARAGVGFSYAEGKYREISVPGSTATFPLFVAFNGDMTGSYATSNSSGRGLDHGFLFSNGTYRTIDYPGGTQNSVNAINARGQMLGTYGGPGGPYGTHHIFVAYKGKIRNADLPGAFSAYVTSSGNLNSSGSFVGYYYTQDQFILYGQSIAFVAVCDPPGSTCVN